MPLYEYECEACGRRFELIQRFSDPPQETCISCGGGPVRKLISSPAIQFKGTGWYVTDYAAKDNARAREAGEKEEAGEKDRDKGKEKGKDKETKPADASSSEPAKGPSSSEGSSTSPSNSSSESPSTSGTKSS